MEDRSGKDSIGAAVHDRRDEVGGSGRATGCDDWNVYAGGDRVEELGIEALTGSLLPGKAADITAVNLSEIDISPCYDPLSHLIYAAGREHVSHVWVNGELVLEDRQLVKLDTRELKAKAAYWQQRIAAPSVEHPSYD